MGDRRLAEFCMQTATPLNQLQWPCEQPLTCNTRPRAKYFDCMCVQSYMHRHTTLNTIRLKLSWASQLTACEIHNDILWILYMYILCCQRRMMSVASQNWIRRLLLGFEEYYFFIYKWKDIVHIVKVCPIFNSSDCEHLFPNLYVCIYIYIFECFFSHFSSSRLGGISFWNKMLMSFSSVSATSHIARH